MKQMERVEEEMMVVEKMVRLYCKRKEGNDTLCEDCSEVLDYSFTRLYHCRFGNDKPTCKKCPVHCYAPEMKARIRKIMRWAGPRMILYYPKDAIKHLWREL